jgi:hypothetical protein
VTDTSQTQKERLVEISASVLRLSEQALLNETVAAFALTGLVMVATSTPNHASADERRVHSASARSRLKALLGADVREAVSYTRGVTIIVGLHDPTLRIAVDIERLHPERSGIARRTLTDHELAALGGEPVPWIELLRVFCIKEAGYKVLLPESQLGLGFRSLQVDSSGASADVRLVGSNQPCARVATAVGQELMVAVAELP